MSDRKPVLVAVVHDVLNAETFDMLADLCEAIKRRAARLRIPYDATVITEALTAVKHVRPLVRETLPQTVTSTERPPEDELIPRDLAARVLQDLRQRTPKTPQRRGRRLMQFWTTTSRRHHCGKCGETIPGGAVALRLTLVRSQRELWRCTACVGQPPPDVVLDQETAAIAKATGTLSDRVAALMRRFAAPDWKSRQTGDNDDAA
jgi:hypothetical protein